MIKEATIIAGLVCCLGGEIAQAQPADCLTTINAKLPLKVTFDDGSTIVALERTKDNLRSEAKLSDGRKTDGSTYQGLFPLTRQVPSGTLRFNWTPDLAQFFPLKVGTHIVADASVLLPGNNRARTYATEMSVLAEETLRIGGCDYPVFKIEVSSRLDQGFVSDKAIHYHHAASMLTLRTLTPTTPPEVVERRAIRIE